MTNRTRLDSYELASRMQSEMPEAIDIDLDAEATRVLCGVGGPKPGGELIREALA